MVTSGGNENDEKSAAYEDRLYLNNGKGKFSLTNFPKDRISSSVACVLDFNNDNLPDIFIGGRQIPGRYGYHTTSKLYENKGNAKFEPVSISAWDQLGMVTDAKWADIDGNDQNELIITGEWMPLSIWDWKDNTFVKREVASP